MCISLGLGLLGSAIIGGGAAAIGSSKNSKAINQATQAQTDSNAQSIALQSQIYGQNVQALSPFQQRGNAAGAEINALLGIGGSQPQYQPQAQPNAFAQFSGYNPAEYGDVNGPTRGFDGRFDQIIGAANNYLRPQGGIQPSETYGYALPSAGGPIGSQAQTPGQAQNNAFENFRNSTGYQFRRNEGLDAVSSAYAGSGMFQSGAALRGINEYGQNFASNEFGNYVGLLGQQQGVGLSAAGAQAGVGVNYAGSVGALNQANADAISAGAVARANNSNAFIGSIGNLAGGALGYLGGR